MTMKPQLGGLLFRHGPPKDVTNLGGFVDQEVWSSLEPSQGKYDFSNIDKAAAFAKAHKIAFKERIYCGCYAPTWAKSLGGAPMPYTIHNGGGQTTVGRWYSPPGSPYFQAHDALFAAVGKHIDAIPECRAVNVSAVHSETAEVCLIFGNTPQNTVGYKESDRQAALLAHIDTLARSAPSTHIDLACHPLHTLGPGPYGPGDSGTLALAKAVHAKYPSQLTIFHTGLGDKMVDPHTGQVTAAGAWYTALLGTGIHLDLQTETLGNGFSNPPVTLGWAIRNGVMSIELPTGLAYGAPQYAALNSAFQANAAAR